MAVHTRFSNLVTKITVYETNEAFYVVGSDDAEQNFRILEISRNDRRELVLHDDQKIYTVKKIREHLDKIRLKEKRKLKSDKDPLKKVAFGYFLAGFVRFTEGYYMILVTTRLKVAVLGSHSIYKVEGTNMIYMPSDKITKNQNPDEQRYVKLFESMDLSDNFYFSFTYDLTHTLQYNLEEMKKESNMSPETPYAEARQRPLSQFVWNEYLLEPCKNLLHDDWIVYLMHGYLSQLNMVVFGKHIYITLIARRSNRYAGPRFLKRGCNPTGCVANEVETEQIVSDASQTSLDHGPVTSYVQLRGSIPLFWSQDINKTLSKPPIILHFSDPYGRASSIHFKDLLMRYGAPVIVMSLVKRKERRKRESILWDELVQSLDYLNTFMPEEHQIKYVAFDMARSNKKKGANVLKHLDDISERCIEKTGLFVRNCKGYSDTNQYGVIRTNCVDCLDRTNTAQFAVGKHILSKQLKILGVIPAMSLEFDTDCMRMLETLYEDQGDTIALQYGGSALVHRVQSYRKTDPFASHSNDILQNLSRYYSNSFSDAEKQQAFNVFLGIFRPYQESTSLWDLSSDYYLHCKTSDTKCHYSEWVPPDVYACLPGAYNLKKKGFSLVYRECPSADTSSFDAVHRTGELTVFDSQFGFTIPNSIRNYMPKNVSLEQNLYAASPFDVRKAMRWRNFLNQRSSNTAADQKEATETVFHSSVGSTTEDTDSSNSEESDIECKLDSAKQDTACEPPTSDIPDLFAVVLRSPEKAYGVNPESINKTSIKHYNYYQKFFEQTIPEVDVAKVLDKASEQITLACKSIFRHESVYEVVPPTVKKEMKKLYTHCITIGHHGAQTISKQSERMYESYLREPNVT